MALLLTWLFSSGCLTSKVAATVKNHYHDRHRILDLQGRITEKELIISIREEVTSKYLPYNILTPSKVRDRQFRYPLDKPTKDATIGFFCYEKYADVSSPRMEEIDLSLFHDKESPSCEPFILHAIDKQFIFGNKFGGPKPLPIWINKYDIQYLKKPFLQKHFKGDWARKTHANRNFRLFIPLPNDGTTNYRHPNGADYILLKAYSPSHEVPFVNRLTPNISTIICDAIFIPPALALDIVLLPLEGLFLDTFIGAVFASPYP